MRGWVAIAKASAFTTKTQKVVPPHAIGGSADTDVFFSQVGDLFGQDRPQFTVFFMNHPGLSCTTDRLDLDKYFARGAAPSIQRPTRAAQ